MAGSFPTTARSDLRLKFCIHKAVNPAHIERAFVKNSTYFYVVVISFTSIPSSVNTSAMDTFLSSLLVFLFDVAWRCYASVLLRPIPTRTEKRGQVSYSLLRPCSAGILEQSMGARNRVVVPAHQPICSLSGRCDNPIPTRFLAPTDCSKIPALR